MHMHILDPIQVHEYGKYSNNLSRHLTAKQHFSSLYFCGIFLFSRKIYRRDAAAADAVA